MSTKDASSTTGDTTENCTGNRPQSEAIDAHLPQHVFLGRDTEGFNHHLDRERDAVLRFDDVGCIERITALADNPDDDLDAYLAFVADHVGWETRYQIATWDVWGRR